MHRSPDWGFQMPLREQSVLQPRWLGTGSWQGKEVIDRFLPVIQNGFDVRPFIAVAGILTQFI